MLTTPLQMFLVAIAGWINQHQRLQLEFALEQVRVFKELTGGKRLRLNDDQRCRLRAPESSVVAFGTLVVDASSARTSYAEPPTKDVPNAVGTGHRRW